MEAEAADPKVDGPVRFLASEIPAEHFRRVPGLSTARRCAAAVGVQKWLWQCRQVPQKGQEFCWLHGGLKLSEMPRPEMTRQKWLAICRHINKRVHDKERELGIYRDRRDLWSAPR